MTLGEVIKTYRKTNRVTIQEFANRSGLSKGYISMLENNRHPGKDKPIIPSIDTVIKVAGAMDLTLSYLLEILDSDQLIEIPESQVPDYSFIDDSLTAVEILQQAFVRSGYFDDVEFTEAEILDIIQFAHFLIMKRGHK